MGNIKTVRIATLNMFGLGESWPARRELVTGRFADFSPDLAALQEVVTNDSVNQAHEVLGDSYEFVHHAEREAGGQATSLASRRPITAVHEVALLLGPRSAGFTCSALVADIVAPDPVGRLLFVNHLPDWQLTHEAERERETVLMARVVEDLVGSARIHVIVAGDLDATPDVASIRFWTEKQSLDEWSVCYRD